MTDMDAPIERTVKIESQIKMNSARHELIQSVGYAKGNEIFAIGPFRQPQAASRTSASVKQCLFANCNPGLALSLMETAGQTLMSIWRRSYTIRTNTAVEQTEEPLEGGPQSTPCIITKQFRHLFRFSEVLAFR
jgi:hypothetical protein